MKHLFYIVLMLMAACGSSTNLRTCDLSTYNTPAVELHQDSHGFVEYEKCDSLFLSGLVSASGIDVDLGEAEINSGEWLRRPADYAECYAAGESRSTISRDQLLGVYWYAWRSQDVDMLERLWDFGKARNWKMGDGRLLGADTVLNPAMISTLAQMLYMMGSDRGSVITRNLPVSWSVKYDTSNYYVNRLTALHLLLRKEAYGSISAGSQGVLIEMTDKWPGNPLFAIAAGRKCRAAANISKFEETISERDTTRIGVHNEDEYKYEVLFVISYLERKYM